MDFSKYELRKIKIILDMIDKKNIKDADTLKYLLSEEDYKLFCKYVDELETTENIIHNEDEELKELGEYALKEAQRIINETPYTILNIEEKKYSKEELFNIIGKIINNINKTELEKEIKDEKIDRVLDACNEIIKKQK